MNKFWMVTIGTVAAIVVLSTLPNLFGMAITGAVIYASIHFYMKSETSFAKVFWAIVGICGAISAISNVPALFGLAAAYLLWQIYRNWDDNAAHKPGCVKLEKKSDDPFTNFEKEWDNITK